MNKLKIGLDIHGVCDKHPEFFSVLTNLLVNNGHEVHILTGAVITDKLLNDIKSLDIAYTHIFSITEYREMSGARVIYDDNGSPWMTDDDWNTAKAEYCTTHNISLHIDDSKEYGKYFKTPYCLLI